MNGGHYLTKGHAILSLLYIKMSLMSRKILDPKKNRFPGRKQPLVAGSIHPFNLFGRMDHQRSFNFSDFRKRELFRLMCVFFNTGTGKISGRFFPTPPRTHGLLSVRTA